MTDNFIHGDAHEVVGGLGEFDAVMTDPPYPTGGESSIRSKSGIMEARLMIDGLCHSFLAVVLGRISYKENSCIWLFCDWRQVSFYSYMLRGLGFASQSCIVWDKGHASLSNKYHPQHELVLFGYKGRLAEMIAHKYLGTDIVKAKRDKGGHPFSKPAGLARMMAKSFKPGRVLDPFCGTGGLLAGMKDLGWEIVGVDIDKEYITQAGKEIQNARTLWDG